jgi:hypothetical protein
MGRCSCCSKQRTKLQRLPIGWESTNIYPKNKGGKCCEGCAANIRNSLQVCSHPLGACSFHFFLGHNVSTSPHDKSEDAPSGWLGYRHISIMLLICSLLTVVGPPNKGKSRGVGNFGNSYPGKSYFNSKISSLYLLSILVFNFYLRSSKARRIL